MYERFLNNNDYLSIITEEALSQLIRNNTDRYAMAEEAAEQSVVEYLTMNYEIEDTLEVGKRLIAYDRRITYPSGVHFYMPDGKIVKTLKTINGAKSPMSAPCWEEYLEPIEDEAAVQPYTQRNSYRPGDIVAFGTDRLYVCLDYNGPDFGSVRVPDVNAWERITAEPWEPNVEYEQWEVVSYDGDFFTLMVDRENRNLTKNPMASNDWGKIGEYDSEYTYELSPYEYVVYKGEVYYPVMNPNADNIEIGVNVKYDDPRNANVKKHMLRLALYELHKLISPANISSSRITDYEMSIAWLRDASKLRLNPGIPRKLARNKRPVTDYAIASFVRNYDPAENMWHF